MQRQKFGKFDFGKVKNLERYETEEPPVYDLKSITCMKFAIMNGTADQINNDSW